MSDETPVIEETLTKADLVPASTRLRRGMVAMGWASAMMWGFALISLIPMSGAEFVEKVGLPLLGVLAVKTPVLIVFGSCWFVVPFGLPRTIRITEDTIEHRWGVHRPYHLQDCRWRVGTVHEDKLSHLLPDGDPIVVFPPRTTTQERIVFGYSAELRERFIARLRESGAKEEPRQAGFTFAGATTAALVGCLIGKIIAYPVAAMLGWVGVDFNVCGFALSETWEPFSASGGAIGMMVALTAYSAAFGVWERSSEG